MHDVMSSQAMPGGRDCMLQCHVLVVAGLGICLGTHFLNPSQFLKMSMVNCACMSSSHQVPFLTVY